MEPTLSKNMRYWFGEKRNYQVSAVEQQALTAAHEALMTSHIIHQGRLVHIETYTPVARKWNRIVIGAHGPYVEFTHYHDFFKQLVLPEDQLWRAQDKRYKDKVKYWHYEPEDIPGLKVYLQRRPVEYADYRPGCFYVDLYKLINA